MKAFATSAEKSKAIDSAIKHNDFPLLRQYCVSKYGLVSDRIRIKVWPKLLGLTTDSDLPSNVPASKLKTSYEHQITVDILRSLNSFDLVKGISQEARRVRALQLTRVITRIVSEDTSLHYFQGFHDICSVFLLVAGEELGYRLIRRFVYTYCRDAMRPSFDLTSRLMALIPLVIRAVDVPLYEQLLALQQEMPMFALSWVLTYFAHVVPSFEKVTRIFDFCIGTHPLSILYLSAALIIDHREATFKMHDLSDIHNLFSRVLSRVDWDEACLSSESLLVAVPPQLLLKQLTADLPFE